MHVVPGLGAGGMELAMAGVIRGLDLRDMQHTVICLKEDPAIADRLPPSTRVICLHSRPNDLRLPGQLWRHIGQLRPTVIHARNWGAWPDIAVARLGRIAPAPLVFSFHGFAAAHTPLRRRIAFRVLARMTTHLLAVSTVTRDLLVRDFGWPKGRVQVIPNGVDTRRFAPISEHRPATDSGNGRLILAAVGNLTAVKNHALLVKACAGLSRAGVDFELRIAGEGPLRNELTALANELGISQRVLLAGHQADVPAFLREADVFVLPSASESHPNALLEAMACGLPCVATNVGGVAEVLGDGKYGLLAAPNDSDGLSQAIAALARDGNRRRKLGAAARERACSEYSMTKMLSAYEEMYRTLSSRDKRATSEARAARKRRLSAGDSTNAKKAESQESQFRPRVLMMGPLPPLTGGMATVTTNLSASRLRETCDLLAMNNGKVTPEKRSLFTGVSSQLQLLGRFAKAISQHRAQIVHIHTCALFSWWRDQLHMLTARALGAKVVWHLHDGTFHKFLSQGNPIKLAAIRWGLGRASAVVVLSETGRQTLEPHAPRANWQVVTNAVPLPDLNATASLVDVSVPNGKPLVADSRETAGDCPVRFLFLGNLTRRKGAYDLVDAAAAACSQGADLRVTLCGPEVVSGQRQELLDHIAKLPCPKRFTLPGVVAGEQKTRELAQAHCLVLPSYAEGLPMAILEGMSFGLPVIATRVGSIPEAVRDGREGFLLETGDVEGLTRCMLALCRDGELRQRMGQNARRRVEQEFSMDVIVDRIMAMYQGILCDAPIKETQPCK